MNEDYREVIKIKTNTDYSEVILIEFTHFNKQNANEMLVLNKFPFNKWFRTILSHEEANEREKEKKTNITSGKLFLFAIFGENPFLPRKLELGLVLAICKYSGLFQLINDKSIAFALDANENTWSFQLQFHCNGILF